MREASNTASSPFPRPRMECRECGKEPHEGYCYPVLDGLLTVLLVIVLFICVPVLLVVVSG